MGDRKEGYYWVRVLTSWEPAFWNGKEWSIIGTAVILTIGVQKVGPEIIFPKDY